MNGRATQMAGGLEEEGRVVVRAAAIEEVAARNGDAQKTSPAGVDRKNVECVSPWASDVLSFASHPVPARRKSRRQRRGVPRRRETPPNAKGGGGAPPRTRRRPVTGEGGRCQLQSTLAPAAQAERASAATVVRGDLQGWLARPGRGLMSWSRRLTREGPDAEHTDVGVSAGISTGVSVVDELQLDSIEVGIKQEQDNTHHNVSEGRERKRRGMGEGGGMQQQVGQQGNGREHGEREGGGQSGRSRPQRRVLVTPTAAAGAPSSRNRHTVQASP